MSWTKLFLVIFAILIIRYFVFAGGAYWYFWKHKRKQSEAKKIQKIPFSLSDIKREISYSILTSAIFASIAAFIRTDTIKPYTKIYSNLSEYGYWWLAGSIIFLLVFHDTYFYWMHRLVHKASIYKVVHKIHHDSKNPTPFAAFSFHPIEAVLEMIWMPALHFVIPLHQGVVIVFSIIALLMNVMGHLGVEIYPESWATHPVLKYLNRSENHNDHHKYFKNNYGLYFTWWDRVLGTFSEHASRSKKGQSLQTAPQEFKIDAYSSM